MLWPGNSWSTLLPKLNTYTVTFLLRKMRFSFRIDEILVLMIKFSQQAILRKPKFVVQGDKKLHLRSFSVVIKLSQRKYITPLYSPKFSENRTFSNTTGFPYNHFRQRQKIFRPKLVTALLHVPKTFGEASSNNLFEIHSLHYLYQNMLTQKKFKMPPALFKHPKFFKNTNTKDFRKTRVSKVFR